MNTIISSDDSEAIAKLKAKLTTLERRQEDMKATNKAIRMKDIAKGNAELINLGYTLDDIRKLRTPDLCGRIGYPSYAITNNNANIRNVRERIAQLEARKNAPTPKGWDIEGGEVICNVDINRIQIHFNEIPNGDIRATLKSHGFKWSSLNRVWQRQLTENAIATTRYIFPPVKA